MDAATLDSLLAYLKRRLSRLECQGLGWQVEIHGKGSAVTVKVTETVTVTEMRSGKVQLEESR